MWSYRVIELYYGIWNVYFYVIGYFGVDYSTVSISIWNLSLHLQYSIQYYSQP